jgi:CubicO group peptidase (beta-lactamase class C family)
MQDRVAQFLMGAFDVKGKLETTINSTWTKGMGLEVKGNGRLKYTVPEELGISSKKIEEIDQIVENSIEAKAFPGCQIVVAIEGKVIHQKSYGKLTYESEDSVTNEHIYDIASITKIASSTVSLMKLDSEGKFNVTSTLGTLVPEYVSNTPYAALKANDLLTHQAGLTPWIAFYKKTLKDGDLDPSVYRKQKETGFETQVAKGIYIKTDYWRTILKTITEAPLSGVKKYEYSDLSYYFFNKFIEKTSGMGQEDFVQQKIYAPLGLQRMTYLPLKKFPVGMIAPTENDKEFRKQVIQGYVHDPGAAMMGGVAGHAGLFSNATDLAALMQLLLNKGQIGSLSIINKEVVDAYTKCQFCPGNRRGLGFDKPSADGSGGPVSNLTSLASFGHSGFTGTLAWADPTYQINYVFLSNRVSPNADNWKIRDMNIRTNIQKVIYEAYKSRVK